MDELVRTDGKRTRKAGDENSMPREPGPWTRPALPTLGAEGSGVRESWFVIVWSNRVSTEREAQACLVSGVVSGVCAAWRDVWWAKEGAQCVSGHSVGPWLCVFGVLACLETSSLDWGSNLGWLRPRPRWSVPQTYTPRRFISRLDTLSQTRFLHSRKFP